MAWSEEMEKLAQQIGDEKNVIGHIRVQLAARDWSPYELSKKMEAAGHSMHRSVLSRLLGDAPGQRRYVSVDQVIGLSKVFGVSIAELMLPVGIRASVEAASALADAEQLWSAAEIARARWEAAKWRIAGAFATDHVFRDFYRDNKSRRLESLAIPEGQEDDSVAHKTFTELDAACARADEYSKQLDEEDEVDG